MKTELTLEGCDTLEAIALVSDTRCDHEDPRGTPWLHPGVCISLSVTAQATSHCVLNESTYYAASAGEIVDPLKELAEIVIWGKANNYDAIFDYFCEENLMGFLTYVLPKSPFRVVRIQLLQTISMMLHNLQNERTLYFILSNNHINTLICTPSMYSGGDVSSWTAALLKTVSGLLNSVTIKFFYNEVNDTFPLLEEALRFLSCSDSMKCAHVMTIILNIVRVNDAAVTPYMIKKNSYMISKLALHLRTSWRRLNNQIKRSNMDTVGQTEKILLTSCDDVFQFLQDVMDVANAEIKEALLQRIFMTCSFPLVGKYGHNKTDLFARNYTESNNRSSTMAITWYPDPKILNGSEVSYCKPRKETSVHDIDLIFETSDDLSNYVKEFKDRSMKRIRICSDILRSYFLDTNI